MSSVTLAIEGGAAVVTLNQPDTRNAINLPMVDDIIGAFDALEADLDVKAVVVTGAGRSFCAGADLGALESGDPRTYAGIYQGFLRVARCPLPTIAAVNGAATGAGMNLALCCDVRVAARSARFVARFLDLGLHPGGGHTWMLQRTIGHEMAVGMLLFGQDLTGEDAHRRGLALACVEDDQLLAYCLSLASHASHLPRELVERTMETLHAVLPIDHQEDAVAIESRAQRWSVDQEFFRERVAEMRKRISGKGPPSS